MYPTLQASDLIPYGRIRKTHGYQGAVIIALDSEYVYELEPEFLFIAIDEIPVPFRVDDMRGSMDQWIVSLEGIQNLEHSDPLVGFQVYVHREERHHNSNDSDQILLYHTLVGFTLKHANGIDIGTVVYLDTSTANLLLTVDRPSGEVYIPLVEEWVVGLDEKKQSITMNFPMQLLEL